MDMIARNQDGREYLPDWINKRSITPGQILLVILLAAGLLLDGVDLKLLAYFAPLILKDWHITELELGPTLSAALVGMAIGSGIGGWVGDRIGPRRTAIACVLLFASATVACGYAPNLLTLTLFRFISGLGFGGLNPNAYALIADWLPKRVFPSAVAMLAVCAPLGGVIGAGVALTLIPLLGWQGCFVAVGVVSLLLGLSLIRLPEAWSYLQKSGKSHAIQRSIHRVVGGIDTTTIHYGKASQNRHVAAAGSIFEPQLIRFTTGASLCYFAGNVISFGFNSWLYVSLTSAGLLFSDAVRAGICFNAVAMTSGLLAGWFTHRFGSKLMLILSGLLTLLVMVWLSWVLAIAVPHHFASAKWQVLLTTGLAGGSIGCVISTLTIVMTAGFPATRRATGVGFGIMVGRIGAILVTLVGGALLSLAGKSPLPLFAALAFLSTFIVLSAFVIDRHISPRARGQELPKGGL